MSEQVIFFTNPMSRGRIIRWMLEETGIKYQTKVIEYKDIKSAEYLAINPMGKVPAIKHGSTIVTETAAICVYLAETFTDAALAPITANERAAYYRWLFFTAGPVEQAIGFKSLGTQITDEQERMLGCGHPQTTIDTLIKAVGTNPYIAGNRFTAADVYVGSQIGWGLQYGTMGAIDKNPELVKYWERISARDAHKRAEEMDNALIKH